MRSQGDSPLHKPCSNQGSLAIVSPAAKTLTPGKEQGSQLSSQAGTQQGHLPGAGRDMAPRRTAGSWKPFSSLRLHTI